MSVVRERTFVTLRSIQIVLALGALIYVLWQFAHGQLAGDIGVTLLLLVVALGVAAEIVRLRKRR